MIYIWCIVDICMKVVKVSLPGWRLTRTILMVPFFGTSTNNLKIMSYWLLSPKFTQLTIPVIKKNSRSLHHWFEFHGGDEFCNTFSFWLSCKGWKGCPWLSDFGWTVCTKGTCFSMVVLIWGVTGFCGRVWCCLGYLPKINSCMSKNLWRRVFLNLLFASPCAFSMFVYFLLEDKDGTGKFSRGPPTRKSLVHNWLTNSKRRSPEIPGVSNPKEIPPVAELNQHGLPFVDITIRSPFVSSPLLIAEILHQLISRRLDPHFSWCFNINRWSQHFIQPPFILLEQFSSIYRHVRYPP